MTDRALRSLLFTPATRTQSFAKAEASGADCVCLDLEDAVPPAQKAEARPAALAWLKASADGPLRGLRINALSSAAGMADLAELAQVAPREGLLMLPKVGSAEEVRLAAAVLDEAGSGLALAALVETAVGLAACEPIAAATPRLTVVVFGGVDLAADLGADAASNTMRVARARILQAAHAAGREVLDVPELSFRDIDGVAAAAQVAVREGFTGKAAIHPTNIAAINAAFTPDAEAIADAQRIVAAFEGAPGGLAELDGKLIEAPVVKGARRRLARARAAGAL